MKDIKELYYYAVSIYPILLLRRRIISFLVISSGCLIINFVIIVILLCYNDNYNINIGESFFIIFLKWNIFKDINKFFVQYNNNFNRNKNEIL